MKKIIVLLLIIMLLVIGCGKPSGVRSEIWNDAVELYQVIDDAVQNNKDEIDDYNYHYKKIEKFN